MINQEQINLILNKEYCMVILTEFADIEFVSKFKGMSENILRFENPTTIHLEKFDTIEELNTPCLPKDFPNFKYRLRGENVALMIYE